MAILCVVAVAIMSFFLWRDAENDPQPSPAPRAAQWQNAELLKEKVERAEQYAREAEAAALRAQATLETLLLIEARILAASQQESTDKPATAPSAETGLSENP